jgi:outer membrane PBP1 activator LpoA protein
MVPRPLVRLALMLLAVAAVSGCPSLTERAGLPPSVDRAEALERSGDAAGAARVYEALAAQNSGADRNDFLLRAARAYLTARRLDDAARVLAGTEPPLTADQGSERALLGIELTLDRGQVQEAQRQLAAMPPPRAAAQAARYHALQSRVAALAAGQPQVAPAPVPAAGPHIALLLPVTGRAAGAALSVRDGFMTAYY